MRKNKLITIILLFVLASVQTACSSVQADKAETMTEIEKSEDVSEVVDHASIGDMQIYAEEELSGVTYRVREGGIYRVLQNGEECIYQGFVDENPIWTVFDGRLYFATNRNNQDENVGGLKNTIKWVDLTTLETGAVALAWDDKSDINFFSIWNDGFLYVSDLTGSNTTILPLLEPHKNVYMASDGTFFFYENPLSDNADTAEKEKLGRTMSQWLRENPTKLLDVSNRRQDRTFALLDMEGKGEIQEISLYPDITCEDEYNELWEHYCLEMNGNVITGYEENLSNGIWAYSPDGIEIIVALYADGPSADPATRLFTYNNGTLQEIGVLEDDIRYCKICDNGMISGVIRNDTIQTDWIEVSWYINEEGKLEQIENDSYAFCALNDVELLVPITVQKWYEGGEMFTIEPQTIHFTGVSGDFQWVEIATLDGTRGWFSVQELEEEYPEWFLMDVFENRQYAD